MGKRGDKILGGKGGKLSWGGKGGGNDLRGGRRNDFRGDKGGKILGWTGGTDLRRGKRGTDLCGADLAAERGENIIGDFQLEKSNGIIPTAMGKSTGQLPKGHN